MDLSSSLCYSLSHFHVYFLVRFSVFLFCLSITDFSCFRSLHSIMASSNVLPSLLPLEPCIICEYNSLLASCWNVQRFQSMGLDGERNWVYGNRYGFDCLFAVCRRVKYWIHRGGCGAFLLCDKAKYVYMPFICCTEQEVYAHRVAAIVTDNLSLANDVPVTLSPDYVAFTSPYDTLHFLSNLDYWLTKILFEERFCVRTV